MALRVLRHTGSVLEIEDCPTRLRLMGALFALAGAGVFTLGWLEDRSLEAGVVGLVFLAVGVLLVVTTADRRHRLDRRAGTLTVEIRGQGTVAERSLGDLADVVIEASPGPEIDESRTYRLTYVFADRSRLQWRSYYGGARRDVDACARLVREFLRLDRRAAS